MAEPQDPTSAVDCPTCGAATGEKCRGWPWVIGGRPWVSVWRSICDACALCPNSANHTPHPTGYGAHSNWVYDAMVVAVAQKCHGCDWYEIWRPKRPDLRIAVAWPPPTCDWGSCDQDGVAERLHAGPPPVWLPVCKTHTGVSPERPKASRGLCTGCGKNRALTTAGRVYAHDNGWNRCAGSGRPPRKDGTDG